MKEIQVSANPATVINADVLLDHWQGHRRATRRFIEAFPDDKLFTYSVGGMRPFSALVLEMLGMAVPGLRGAVTGKWEHFDDNGNSPKTKADLLKLWDNSTGQINELVPQISSERFKEVDKAFGQWEGPIHWIILYAIDNEIHHRGQASVYLRSLGIEPPAFWDRS